MKIVCLSPLQIFELRQPALPLKNPLVFIRVPRWIDLTIIMCGLPPSLSKSPFPPLSPFKLLFFFSPLPQSHCPSFTLFCSVPIGEFLEHTPSLWDPVELSFASLGPPPPPPKGVSGRVPLENFLQITALSPVVNSYSPSLSRIATTFETSAPPDEEE